MTDPRPSQPLLAVLWMTGALASFTSMAIAARELTQEVTIFQVSFMRTVICLLVLLPLAWRYGWSRMRTDRLGGHLVRNFVHFGGQFGWFYGVSVLPLAVVFSLEFSAPLWTALLAAVLLKERLTPSRVASVILGFVGILVILRPGSELIQPASFVVIGAAVCFAATYVSTRHLSSTESAFKIIFYMNVIQLPMGLIPSLPVWVTPSEALWPYVALLGIAGLTSHYCVARAMACADATIVAPMDFIRLPLITVIGFVLYAEPWNLWVILGGAVTFSGNLLNIWAERRPATRH